MHKRNHGALLARRPEAIHPKTGGVAVIGAATDFTSAGSTAVRRAAQIAKTHGASIALMHVSTPVSRMVTTVLDALGASDRPGHREADANLRETAERITTAFGVPVETHLVSGSVPDAIAALVQAAQTELVVLGNPKGNSIVNLLWVNTARRVRRRAGTPVLAVSRPVLTPYTRVILAADLTPETAHAEGVARRLFPGAMLTVLHAFELPHEGTLALADASTDVVEEYRSRAAHEAKEQLRLFARAAAFDEKSILEVQVGNPAARIRKRVRELNADVLILRPSESWLTQGMTDGMVEQLLADPPCDVLLVG